METNILIVDDHPLLRKGIVDLVRSHFPDWRIHEAGNGVEAVRMAEEIRPEMILMDYRMPKLDGLKASAMITEKFPEIKIIMVSMEEGVDYVKDAIDARVSGMVSKTYSEFDLLDAINTVRSGKTYLNDNNRDLYMERLFEMNRRKVEKKHQGSSLLTDRELEIIEYVTRGKTTVEIADRLSISRRTVEGHRANILKKCQVKSTPELIRYAISKNLVSL